MPTPSTETSEDLVIGRGVSRAATNPGSLETQANAVAATTFSDEAALDAVVARLQRKNNPFNDYVHANRPPRRGGPAHVDTVHKDVCDTLRHAVEHYCLGWQEAANGKELEVPWSGAIVVIGRRGEGKTHLLYRELSKFDAVVVAPAQFETYRPFREFLLVELVARLQRDLPHRSDLVQLAQWFTRKLLHQAISVMSEVDWICLYRSHCEASVWNQLFAARTSKRYEQARNKVLEGLREDCSQPLEEFADEHDIPHGFLRDLALGHVERAQIQRTASQKLRATIYRELVEVAFDPMRTEVFEVLLSDADNASADEDTKVSRSTLVDERLSCLVELFLLFGRPVVFAFDALELLLEDPPRKEDCQRLHNGVAQVIDLMPGIPFFIFAEEGHWQQAAKHFSSYAEQRFQRGIPVPRKGAVSRLDLGPLDSKGLANIVKARLRPLLDDLHLDSRQSEHAEILPFGPSDLAQALNAEEGADHVPTLRIVLQRLQRRYEQIVFQRDPVVDDDDLTMDDPSDSTMPSVGVEELASIWERELAIAERSTEDIRGLSQLSDRLHQGVKVWLECLVAEGAEMDGWELASGEITTFGTDLRFGECLVCQWSKGKRRHRQGLAFLLGAGRGMPADLECKTEMMQSTSRVVDSMMLLWPRSQPMENAADALPPATEKVWKSFHRGQQAHRLTLQAIDSTAIANWLMLGNFRRCTVDKMNVSMDVLRHFICEKMYPFRSFLKPISMEGHDA